MKIKSKISNYLYRNIFAGADFGRAFSKFLSENYPASVAILEKSIARLPASEVPELVLSILGQSYLAMGQIEKAIEPLKKAFERYQNSIKENQDPESIKQYHEMLRAYGYALQQVGRNEQAEEVLNYLG